MDRPARRLPPLPDLARAAATLAPCRGIGPDDLEPMRVKGLAHHHVRVKGTGLLLRIPRQSQFGFTARDNLRYQATCFARAAPSGSAPRLHGVIAPQDTLPLGALLVDEIDGRPVRLPADLPALAASLARLHLLPLPPVERRAPLGDHADPVHGTLAVIERQAAFVDGSGMPRESVAAVHEEIDWARAFAAGVAGRRQPRALVFTDTHPGNFLVDREGRAICVDLEKMLYGAPGIDLAHASLFTSTTWDIDVQAVLDRAQVERFYAEYLGLVGTSLGERLERWMMPLRRLTWLRTMTWFAKWSVESLRPAAGPGDGSVEDWSTDDVDPRVVEHVRSRIADCFRPETIAHVRSEWLGASPLEL